MEFFVLAETELTFKAWYNDGGENNGAQNTGNYYTYDGPKECGEEIFHIYYIY